MAEETTNVCPHYNSYTQLKAVPLKVIVEAKNVQKDTPSLVDMVKSVNSFKMGPALIFTSNKSTLVKTPTSSVKVSKF